MGSIIGGLIALALGIFAAITWKWRMIELLQGIIPIALITGGIIAVVAGLDLVKESDLSKGKKAKARVNEDEEEENE